MREEEENRGGEGKVKGGRKKGKREVKRGRWQERTGRGGLKGRHHGITQLESVFSNHIGALLVVVKRFLL